MIRNLIANIDSIIRAEMNGGFLKPFVSCRYGPAQVVPTPEQPALIYAINGLETVCGASAAPEVKVNFDFWATAAPTTNVQDAAFMAHSLLWSYFVDNATNHRYDVGLLPFMLYIQGRLLPPDSAGRRWKLIFNSAPKMHTSQADQNIIGAIWLGLSAVLKIDQIVKE